MYNGIHIKKRDKFEDVDKQDLLNYFIIEKVTSRQFDALKFKKLNTKNLKNSSVKLNHNKLLSFSQEDKKPKFVNKYLLKQMDKKAVNINDIYDKNDYKKFMNINNKNKQNNYLKINNIFLNSLKEDKSYNPSILNIESIYNIQNQNLSYIFDKSSRELSDNFNTVKNIYNDLIKRKEVIRNKLKLKTWKSEYNDRHKLMINKQIQTNSNITENNKNNKNKNKISKRNNSDLFEKKPVTCFLSRKTLNNIPLTFPLCLLYKNKYNSVSEKARIENILNKFICLKTHIVNDPSNSNQIIREFIIKNTNLKNEQLSDENIENFLNFLKLTINFDPNKTIKELIKEAMNFDKNKIILTQKKINPKTYMRNDFKYNIINKNQTETKNNNIKEKIKNTSLSSSSIRLEVNEKKFSEINNKTFDIRNKNLNSLLHDLESELNEIKNYQLIQYDFPNIKNVKSMRNKGEKDIFKNKLEKNKNMNMSNICLLNKAISEKYKSLYNDYYKNNRNIKKMKKSLKKINERLYYKNIRKNLIEEYDIEEIKKKFKLTEYIVLQRARQAMILENEKEKCLDII